MNTRDKNQTAFTTEYDIFAERLITAMATLNYNNKELAQKTFVSPSSISAYRCGKRFPSLSTLCKIAEVLNVTTDYLLGLDTKPTVPQK